MTPTTEEIIAMRKEVLMSVLMKTDATRDTWNARNRSDTQIMAFKSYDAWADAIHSPLDTSGFLVQGNDGWEVTEAGKKFLAEE